MEDRRCFFLCAYFCLDRVELVRLYLFQLHLDRRRPHRKFLAMLYGQQRLRQLALVGLVDARTKALAD